MVAIPTDVTVSVERFLEAVRQEWRIREAYLYGSQVRGQAAEWSDIDVAVVSVDRPADVWEDQLRLMRLASAIDPRIEPRLFAADDFTLSNPLVDEIRRRGIRIG